MVSVKALYIYPIKACRGIAVKSAFLSSTGFKWDRMWMVVNAKGRMITQRIEPRLALVEVHLPEEALNGQWGSLPSDAAMRVHAPGMEVLRVPISAAAPRSRVENASVWEWTGSVLDEGPNAADWFTRYLGKQSRLVRFDTDNEKRRSDPAYAAGFTASFTDGFPFLVISQSSLDALNQKLPEPLPISRFRPNILVQGCGPFEEDLWESFTISNLHFHGVKLCSRCKVTTINQETAQETGQPLAILQTFRAGKYMPLSKRKGQVFFGQNAVCEECLNPSVSKYSSVRVGDAVTITNKFPSITDSIV